MTRASAAARIEIRTEREGDRPAVADVLARAFGQTDEAELVAALRADPAWIDGLSVVGLVDGAVAGHALLTRLPVGGDPALALAPVAVAPEAQGVGLGSAMIRDLLRRAAERRERLVVVLGEPAYYARFGFVPAADLGVEGPFERAGNAFQALALGPPGDAPRGWARYPAAFGIPET